MILAAIDIGSNAMRLQIVRVFEENELVSFKNIEFLRFPLRLGKDVFKNGKISKITIGKFAKLMQAFKILIDLYEVDGLSAVATSAMREALNGQEVQEFIFEQSGIKIDIISGDDEARILNKAIIPFLNFQHHIHIDVGGGSTELNIFDGKKLIDSKSFRIGSVRKLSREERINSFNEIQQWIKKAKPKKARNVIGIGTGGNINKLYKLANKTNNLSVSLVELRGLRAYVREFSYEERISILKMNPDRADVIVPAAEIYIKVLEAMGSDQILVPKVGLKDGVVYELFEKVSNKSLDQVAFLSTF